MVLMHNFSLFTLTVKARSKALWTFQKVSPEERVMGRAADKPDPARHKENERVLVANW